MPISGQTSCEQKQLDDDDPTDDDETVILMSDISASVLFKRKGEGEGERESKLNFSSACIGLLGDATSTAFLEGLLRRSASRSRHASKSTDPLNNDSEGELVFFQTPTSLLGLTGAFAEFRMLPSREL